MSYQIREIERAVHEALNPIGMSTHSGMVRLQISHVQRVIKERALLVEVLRATVNTLWAVGANVLGQAYPSAEDVSKALVPTALADMFNDARALLTEIGE